jgi:prepilin-type N-terminal cleavage/methylation domain-containing protein
MKSIILKKSKGFTLVETLVAISILLAVITGAYSAAESGIKSSIYSKNQITAFYLAQEGMEQIRNMRDQNALYNKDEDPSNDRHWLHGISSVASDPCYFGKTCIADSLNFILIECSGGSATCPMLKFDSASGLYGYHPPWPVSLFKRDVRVSMVSADEVSVVVTVYWSRGATNSQFQIRENILNWQ